MLWWIFEPKWSSYSTVKPTKTRSGAIHIWYPIFWPIFDLPTHPYPIFSKSKAHFRWMISSFWKPTYLPRDPIPFTDAPLLCVLLSSMLNYSFVIHVLLTSYENKSDECNELASADEIQSDENISSEVPDIGNIILHTAHF